jgi:hypothetical protein
MRGAHSSGLHLGLGGASSEVQLIRGGGYLLLALPPPAPARIHGEENEERIVRPRVTEPGLRRPCKAGLDIRLAPAWWSRLFAFHHPTSFTHLFPDGVGVEVPFPLGGLETALSGSPGFPGFTPGRVGSGALVNVEG